MESAKIKIKKCVDTYIELQPEEFAEFKKMMVGIRETLSDERFGTAGNTDIQMRALFEMPATLHEIITNNLTVAELEWFKSGGEKEKNGGGKWFAEKFPVFRIPEHV